MNRYETAHESSFHIIEALFYPFIASDRHYFNFHTFIGQQINKRSFENWKLCGHNHGHHANYESFISDISKMMEMRDI